MSSRVMSNKIIFTIFLISLLFIYGHCSNMINCSRVESCNISFTMHLFDLSAFDSDLYLRINLTYVTALWCSICMNMI